MLKKFRLFFLVAALISAIIPPALALETPAKQVILVDASTNTVLFEKNADESMAPSSMSKLMTAYVVFDHLKQGKLRLSDEFTISQKSWAIQGSKMFVAINSRVKVDDLLKGMIVQSGNDACIALAEGISGSEEAFASLSNQYAEKLGLKNSNFVNASGWPDPNHRMTARDLYLLADHLLKDFPEYMHYYQQIDYTYNNIKQGNRNPLLYGFPGGDGLKTGHTDEGGYGLTGTAMRQGRRLILVANGMESMQQRADESRRLLDWGFNEFKTYTIVKKDQLMAEVPVWMGTAEKISLRPSADIMMTVAQSEKKNIEVTLKYAQPIKAPVRKDQPAGSIVVKHPNGTTNEYPLYPDADVDQLSFMARSLKGVRYMFLGME